MTDYISREALMQKFADHVRRSNNSDFAPTPTWNEAVDIVEHFPAADVAEVVRCKDCKWCHSGYCEMYDDLIPFGCANRPWEEWFCADGARMVINDV